MRNVFLILLGLFFFSCNSENEKAKDLCNCYALVHRVQDTFLADQIADSCFTMYQRAIENYSEDIEKLNQFQETYKECQ